MPPQEPFDPPLDPFDLWLNMPPQEPFDPPLEPYVPPLDPYDPPLEPFEPHDEAKADSGLPRAKANALREAPVKVDQRNFLILKSSPVVSNSV
jgi:hypothetical protein